MKKLIKEYSRLAGGRKRRVCDLECTDCGATFTCRKERLETQLKSKCGECWKQECIANKKSKKSSDEYVLTRFTKQHRLFDGRSSHPLYHTYMSMLARCFDVNHKSYHHYGGRGITVCDEWLNDFWMFVYHMGKRPEGTSLDRVDNDYIYCPENCRWATASEQRLNKRK